MVYGGSARRRATGTASTPSCATLSDLEYDETLLVQSGKPVGVFRTHDFAPRVLIANSNLVAALGHLGPFSPAGGRGLTMYGQMTAGSWIYIGSQGIVQGTSRLRRGGAPAFRRHARGALSLTAGSAEWAARSRWPSR